MVRSRSINKERSAKKSQNSSECPRGGKLSNTESPLDGKKSVEAELTLKIEKDERHAYRGILDHDHLCTVHVLLYTTYW